MTDQLPPKLIEAMIEAGLVPSDLEHDNPSTLFLRALNVEQRETMVRTQVEHRLASAVTQAKDLPRLRERHLKAKRRLSAVDRIRRLLSASAPQPAFPAPTLERVSNAPVAEESTDEHGEPLRATRHRLQWPVDAIKGALSAEAYNAAHRLRKAYQVKEPRSAVVSWEGVGGGSPGSRVPVTDRQLRASAEYAFVMGHAERYKPVLRNFVCEETPEGMDRPRTWEEFGQEFYALAQDKRRCRGNAEAGLIEALETLATLYDVYDRQQSQKRRESA